MMAAGPQPGTGAGVQRQRAAWPPLLRRHAFMPRLPLLLAVLLGAGCSLNAAQLQSTVAAQVQLTVAAQEPLAVTVIVMMPVTLTLPPVSSRTPRPTATPLPATPQVSVEMPPDPKTGVDTGHTLFAENFNLLGTWAVFDTERARGTWRQATYVLTLRDTDEIRWVFNGPRASDFYFEGSVAVGACKAGDQYGLVVRADTDASFYAFGVACGGRFRLLRSLNGVYEEVLPWQASPLLARLSGSTQRLGVRAVGSRFGLYINSQLLGQVEDAELTGGRFGIYAGSYLTPELQVTFDDLVAYPILSAAAAAAVAAAPTALPTVAPPATLEPTATVAVAPTRSALPTSTAVPVVPTMAATAAVPTPTVVPQLAMEGASAEPIFTEDFQIPNYWDQFTDATTAATTNPATRPSTTPAGRKNARPPWGACCCAACSAPAPCVQMRWHQRAKTAQVKPAWMAARPQPGRKPAHAAKASLPQPVPKSSLWPASADEPASAECVHAASYNHGGGRQDGLVLRRCAVKDAAGGAP